MKGCVLLHSPETVQRFVAHGAFERLCRNHDIFFVGLLSSELLSDEFVRKHAPHPIGDIFWIPYRNERFQVWHELFNISCIRFEDRSPSFKVRHEEMTRILPEKFKELGKLAQPEVYDETISSMLGQLGPHPELLAVLQEQQPDFIVLPSSLLDYGTDDMLQVADSLEIPVAMLQTGWDNLSSKGLLQNLPESISVWGEQSRQDAIDVQSIPEDRVRLAGAPHFGVFYDKSEPDQALAEQLGIIKGVPTVLFAGTLRYFDETEFLQDLDHRIEKGDLPRVRIVYRPHPWRLRREHEENFFDCQWKHVVMDPEVESSYRATKEKKTTITGIHRVFSMHYLPRLYTLMDAVVSPMSSVLLEALAMGLPTMATTFGDKKHSWSTDKVSQMMHFKEWFEIEDTLVCKEKEAFYPMLEKLLELAGDEMVPERLRNAAMTMAWTDGRQYSDHVAEAVEDILSTTSDITERGQ